MTFNGPITESLMKTNIYSNIRQATLLKVTPKFESHNTGGDNVFKSFFDKAIEGANSVMSDSIAAITDNIAKSVLTLLVSVILFILSLIALKFVTRLLDGVFRMPGLNFLNSVGGMIWGILVALIISYTSLAVISSLALFNDSTIFSKQLESSIIVRGMYEENPVIKYFM